ncbi:hypothetical protein PoB_006515400 [Plakobranchus ocellatus]|uniref:Uncharacterized protein n=1 Tax=Plakobranchus ocellatus TaxID=259542 RepID=A0AAV4D392_9GAST|nr:hypothetical protein PoB_006515400 [Plakobranchus ocellatus]
MSQVKCSRTSISLTLRAFPKNNRSQVCADRKRRLLRSSRLPECLSSAATRASATRPRVDVCRATRSYLAHGPPPRALSLLLAFRSANHRPVHSEEVKVGGGAQGGEMNTRICSTRGATEAPEQILRGHENVELLQWKGRPALAWDQTKIISQF